jgi:hypothetical protein
MNPKEKSKLISFSKEHDEELKEENDQEKEHEKESGKESEKEKLKESDENSPIGFEVIELYNDKVKTNIFKRLKKYYTLIGVILFIILTLSVFCFFIFANRYKDDEKNPLNYSLKKGNTGETKKQGSSTSKNAPTSSEKMAVAFLYPKVTQFMVATGEHLILSGKYNVFFLTKTPGKKDPSFNKNIKRINAYYNHKEILKVVKNNNVDFIIVNETLSLIEINWLKSLGIRLIGVLDNIYSANPALNAKKATLNYKNLELYDAFIQENVEDYNNFQKLNLKKNIFIPNLFTIQQKKGQQQLLLNHNIVALGGLYEKKGGVRSIINAMPLIMEEFPKAKLNIISQDSPSKELSQLISKLKLTKTVSFHPLNAKSEIFSSSSVFILGSLTEICPLALNEAKANSLSCIISSEILDTPLTNTGVIRRDISNYSILSKEVIKIFKDNKYRKKSGRDAKLSLDTYNENVIKLWEKLFIALKTGDKEYQNLRLEVECLFTKKEMPKPPVKAETKKVVPKVPTAKVVSKKETTKTPAKQEYKKQTQKTPTKVEVKKEKEKSVSKKGSKSFSKKYTFRESPEVYSKKQKKSAKTKKQKKK